jgi:hypothetical protein
LQGAVAVTESKADNAGTRLLATEAVNQRQDLIEETAGDSNVGIQ